MADEDELDNQAVEILRGYLRIRTVWAETDYEEALDYVRCLACSAQLEFKTIMRSDNLPVGVIKWAGTVTCVPAIVLNTHMDVSPANEEQWDYPPFEARMDPNCRIYARGAQDTKMIAIQYIEAIKRLKCDGVKMKRNLIIVFMPDEENICEEAMKEFFESEEFQELNPGLWIDRAFAAPCKRAFSLFYGERHKCIANFIVSGTPSPNYVNMPDVAGSKLARLLDVINQYRATQVEAAGGCPDNTDTTAINIVKMDSDQFGHYVPGSFTVRVEARLPQNTCMDKWFEVLQSWAEEAGEGVTLEPPCACTNWDKETSIDDNIFYHVIADTVNEMGYEVMTRINPTESDARFMRYLGKPAFGFSCLPGVTMPLNGANEYIEREKFLLGIQVYYKLLPRLGNAMEC